MELNVDPENTLMIEESVEIDPRRARFPCCIVWTPLPVLSWFIPIIGHIGICREDGVILDFAGPNFVCVDNFAFGAPARYIRIRKDEQCRVSRYPAPYEREDDRNYSETGNDATTWDGALHKSTEEFQHRSYNLLTCNCHSFVANALNRLGFQAGGWNVVSLAIYILLKGQWVRKASILQTCLPFLLVFGLGLTFGGGAFLTYWAIFVAVLVGWFLIGSYCFKTMIYL
nr:protein RTE1-HOMOLOG [Ipomoea batatas]